LFVGREKFGLKGRGIKDIGKFFCIVVFEYWVIAGFLTPLGNGMKTITLRASFDRQTD
jgi:hypothetical protein